MQTCTQTTNLRLQSIIIDANLIWHRIRWKGKIRCPHCGCEHYYNLSSGYKCKQCNSIYNDKTGTVLQASKLPVWMWLWCLYRLANDKVVTCQSLANDLGVNIKTAWLLLQKVRYLLKQNLVLSGTLSIDEMYFGGTWKNKHRRYKEQKMKEAGFLKHNEHYTPKHRKYLEEVARRSKASILALADEHRMCQLIQSTQITRNVIQHVLKQHDYEQLVADEAPLYNFELSRITVNHEQQKYSATVGGRTYTTNAVENRNSWIERIIHGGHIQVKQKYLQLYLNEIAFRLNCSGYSIQDRFNLLCNAISAPVDSVTLQTIKSFDYMAYNGLPEPLGFNDKIYREMLRSGEISRTAVVHSDWFYSAEEFKKKRGTGYTTAERRLNNLTYQKKDKLTEDEKAEMEYILRKDKEELAKQKHTL